MFIFRVTNKYYAFEIEKVKEVAESRHIVKIPKSLDYIKGAINYKGTLYCIIDTAAFFNNPSSYNVSNYDIIILSDEQYKVGFLANSIIGVMEPEKLIISPPLRGGDKGVGEVLEEKEHFIKGYYELNGNAVKLIDAEEVFKAVEDDV